MELEVVPEEGNGLYDSTLLDVYMWSAVSKRKVVVGVGFCCCSGVKYCGI